MSEEKFRGASVRTLPRPNKSYGEGRVCAIPGVKPSSRSTTSGTTAGSTNRCTRMSPAASASAGTRRNPTPTDQRSSRSSWNREGLAASRGGDAPAVVAEAGGDGFKEFSGRPMMVRTAPPERARPYGRIHLLTASHARGRLSVLRADGPRLRGATRCPLCACPMDEDRMQPFTFPAEDLITRGLLSPVGSALFSISTACRHPLTELKTASPSAVRASSRVINRSSNSPSASSAARSVPGSTPASSGGVHQRPLSLAATFATDVSGDLSAAVDQQRVVGVRMSRARILVPATLRGLVEQEHIGRISNT